jgi:hypothetical protein
MANPPTTKVNKSTHLVHHARNLFPRTLDSLVEWRVAYQKLKRLERRALLSGNEAAVPNGFAGGSFSFRDMDGAHADTAHANNANECHSFDKH